MEEFFLKAAALMEEFYWLFLMSILVLAANAAANVVNAINSARSAENRRAQQLAATKSSDIETLQEQMDRIEKLLAEKNASNQAS